MAFGGGNAVKSISDGEVERWEIGIRKPNIPSQRLKPTKKIKKHKPRTMMPWIKGLVCRANWKAGQPVENPPVF